MGYNDYDLGYGYAWIGIIIWIILLGVNIGLAFVVANLARKKGYSYGGFWALSFFVGFLIPLIVVLCMEDKTVPPPYGQYYQPQYGQPYGQPYQQPPYGQPYGQPNQQPPYGQPYGQPNQAQAVCPNCSSSVAGDAVFCPKCGTKIK